MSNTEVSNLLAALKAGTLSLEAVADDFRTRAWAPAARRSTPSNYLEAVEATTDDPEPPVAGSWDDVVTAYHGGDLTDEQYDVLARAAALRM